MILHRTQTAGGAWIDAPASGVAVARGLKVVPTWITAAPAPTATSPPSAALPTTAVSELGYGAAPAATIVEAPAAGAPYVVPPPPAAAYAPPAEARAAPDRSRIVKDILARSRAGYAGSCPCPDSRDSAGRRCGGRSAYSHAGGEAPLCHRDEVTEAMIAGYRSAARRGRRPERRSLRSAATRLAQA